MNFRGIDHQYLSNICRQLKVYSVEDYRVVQSISYPAPILSMAMSVSHSESTLAYCSKAIISFFSLQIVIWWLA